MLPEQGRNEHIREKAYAIWEKEGRPHGRDQAHWYEAEKEAGSQSPQQAGAGRQSSPARESSPTRQGKAEPATGASAKPKSKERNASGSRTVRESRRK